MLKRHTQTGMTLIELMIGLVLLALLTTMAAPSYGTWITNARIRNAAEGILNGMQISRAQAVSLNTVIQIAVGTDSGWTVSNPGTGIALRTQEASDGGQDTSVTILPLGATIVSFNGMGWTTTNDDSSPSITTIDVTAATATGPQLRPLRIVVGTGGAIRMCDPGIPAGDPRSCL